MEGKAGLFWVEPRTGRSITYEQLLRDVAIRTAVAEVLDVSEPYALWVALLASILGGVPVTIPAGPDLPPPDDVKSTAIDLGPEPLTADLLAGRIRTAAASWRLRMFTSGTTGRPKSVQHTFQSLTRGARVGPDHRADVWAFAYNTTHFAGLQVFFQAVMNANPMVYVFDLAPGEVLEAVTRYGITHISATPTFYRARVLAAGARLPSVARVTVGGERSDSALVESLRQAFPNAVLRNVYASTEAGSLFAGDGEYFVVGEALASSVRVGESGELLLHRRLLADPQGDEWFATGDLVETDDGRRFRFVGRATEMINVGGYKVNPHEVEEAIRRVEGVADATVTSRPSSVTGALLVADVLPKGHEPASPDLEHAIRTRLRECLPPHKIPRVIRVVEELGTSRSGKLKR